MALMTGPLSPYVTPEQLTAAPTGVSWSTIPQPNSTPAQQYAEQVNLCQRATSMVDAWCNQVLRCTQQTEVLRGPGFRMNVHSNGTVRLLLSQRPVTQIVSMRVATANVLPYQWTSVANGAWAIERPPLLVPTSSVAVDSGTGGQAVIMGPGYLRLGRGNTAVSTTYLAGWPHCGIAANAAVADKVLHVDDCTGWAPASAGEDGAIGVIHDTAGNQETVSCLASSVPVGPGVLTLAAPLTYAHNAGILLTTLPDQVQWASILYATSMALTRGATATTIQSVSGRSQDSASGSVELAREADMLLAPFRRIM